MSDHTLPWPVGDWDNPRHSTAPSEERTNFVAALTMMGSRIPRLTTALEQLREAIPAFSMDVMLDQMPPGRWAAMIALNRDALRNAAGPRTPVPRTGTVR